MEPTFPRSCFPNSIFPARLAAVSAVPSELAPWEQLRWGQRTLQLASDTDALQVCAVTILRFNESREAKPHFTNKPIPSRSMMA